MSEIEQNKTVSAFETLRKINVNEHTEKKNNLTYLSWAWAWAQFKLAMPDASYEVREFDGKPYLHDPATGYMVFTSVTAGGETHKMWLPVMDFKNATMKQPGMTDINKTIMRCLAKNIAMFGLGLYIYAGEDLPDVEPNETDSKLEGRMADSPDIQEDLKSNGYDAKKVYDAVIEELNQCQNTEMLGYWVKMNKTSRRMNGMPSDLKDDITDQYNKLKQYFAEKGE